MELQMINQVSKAYGISARMLRYYEKIGLIESLRKEGNSYRAYDANALQRLQQIIILRKLCIPMKQISVIINQPDIAEVVEIFKQNISTLDNEINAFTLIKDILTRLADELQKRANVHLNADLFSDSSVISIVHSLPFSTNHIKETVSMEDLTRANDQLTNLADVRVIYLPPMTVAASHATGENCEGKASDALNQFVSESRLLDIKPDTRHFGFDCSDGQTGIGQPSHGYEMWVSIPDDMEVPAPLVKRIFHGGLYAAHMIKMGDFDHWMALRKWVHESEQYRSDWGSVRWAPYDEGMEHCLEEQLNYWGNFQKNETNGCNIQLDLLFPIKEDDIS